MFSFIDYSVYKCSDSLCVSMCCVYTFVNYTYFMCNQLLLAFE